MTIDNTVRTGDKDKDAYIEALEKEIESFNANNSRKLIRSIDLMAGKISSDLDLIATDQKYADGNEVELSNKIVDTFLKMVEKCDKIRNFIQVAEAINRGDVPAAVTTTKTITEVTETTEEEPKVNFFEATQAEVRKTKQKNGKQS